MRNREAAAKHRIDRLAWLLDNSIPLPGTRFRVGLDGFLGLLPVGGDVLAALLSTYILVEAIRMGAGRATLVKMAGNIILETVMGFVPVIGDAFDFAWKANLRNARLLNDSLENRSGVRPAGRVWTALGTAFLLAVVFVVLASGALLLWGIWTVARN